LQTVLGATDAASFGGSGLDGASLLGAEKLMPIQASTSAMVKFLMAMIYPSIIQAHPMSLPM